MPRCCSAGWAGWRSAEDGAKIFAGVYALFAGLVFIASASVLGAPIMHRIFHKLHIDEK